MKSFVKNKTRKIYSLIYYNLIHKRKLNRTVFENINNFNFLVYPTVFNSKDYYSSEILVSFIQKLEGIKNKHILDTGCGSGIISTFAVPSGSFCTAAFKNSESVKYARQNALQNGLEQNIKTIESDLFTILEARRILR